MKPKYQWILAKRSITCFPLRSSVNPGHAPFRDQSPRNTRTNWVETAADSLCLYPCDPRPAATVTARYLWHIRLKSKPLETISTRLEPCGVFVQLKEMRTSDKFHSIRISKQTTDSAFIPLSVFPAISILNN